MQIQTMRRVSLRILLLLLLPSAAMFMSTCTASAQTSAPLPLTLTQAIDLALKQNKALKLAHLSVTDSQYKKEIAHAAYLPHIRNESSLLHVTELAGVQIPAGAFGNPTATGLIPGRDLNIGQGGLTSYTSGTGLVQPLTQMFKIRESNRAATADVNSAKIKVDEAENEVALKVRQLYYSILIGQLKQQAATEEVNASRVKAQESADAIDQGRALEIASLEGRANLLDAQQTALTQNLQIHDLVLTFNDLLGLPLSTRLQLNPDTSPATLTVPSRDEAIHIAQEHSPDIRAAQQSVLKAKAGLAAAKDAYIPDVTGLARYSYQSGVPLLAHNFGTFGFTLSFDVFDGGRRIAEIKESRTLLAEAELDLTKIEEEVAVQVETAYDKIEQMQNMIGVAEEMVKVRAEAARLSDRQFEQNAALASIRAEAHAKAISSQASLLSANLGLVLAQSELKRTIGQMPQ